MIRIFGLLFSVIFFSVSALLGASFLAYKAFISQPFSWPLLVYTLLSVGAFGFVLGLREQSLVRALAEAEEKLAKRVLRRLTKALPDLLAQHRTQIAQQIDAEVVSEKSKTSV